MFVLIPAYEPGRSLRRVVAGVRDADPDLQVVVVDDGSGARYADAFDAAAREGATILRHERNLGKGAALKTGCAYIAETAPGEDVVTADADGQHTPGDIVAVADALREDADAGRADLVLGVRAFDGPVPLRSRVGNRISSALFALAAGWRLGDTQTGLRGIPSPLLAWALEIPGERFEYEQRMLLRLAHDGHAARTVPIATVYLARNASSHFRPLVDSVRVILPVLLFAASSLAAFVVDTLAMLGLYALTGSLVGSIVAARLLSATVNFAVNRHVVFRGRTGAGFVAQLVRYAVLAGALLASNVAWMWFLTDLGVAVLPAKALTEGVLFVLSYTVQRSVVFPREPERDAHATRRRSLDRAEGSHSDRIARPDRMEPAHELPGRNP